MPKVTLEQTALDTVLVCPPNLKHIEYRDTELPGFFLDRRHNGGTYYLHAQKRRIKLGTMDDMTVEKARAKAKELREQILGGTMPELPHKSITFGQLSENYMEYVKPRKRSWKNDQSMLEKRLLPLFGDIRLNNLKRQSIQQMHTDLREQVSANLSPHTNKNEALS